MAKKSHKIASRQAAVSRERKKKKKAQPAERRPVAPLEQGMPVETTEAVETEVAVTVTAPRAAKALPKDSMQYASVYSDLKHVAYIAGPLLLIIIILAFVI